MVGKRSSNLVQKMFQWDLFLVYAFFSFLFYILKKLIKVLTNQNGGIL